MQAFQTFVVPAYVRVDSEEGQYDAQSGYNLVAKTQDANGIVTEWVYNERIDHEPTAQEAARACKALGFNESMFTAVSVYDPQELPDYVLNPQRPEYN